MTQTEALNFALAQGIIDFSTIQVQIEMYERKKYLDMHKNRIWQGENGKWYTELPAIGGEKRRLIKRKRLEDVEEIIYNFYKTKETHPLVKEVFAEWIATKREWEEIGNTTLNRYQDDFKRYFGDTDFINMRIDFVTEEYLEALIKTTIIKKELTVKSYGNMKTLLMGIMKQAKRKHYTDFSVTSFFGDLQISKKTFKKPDKKKQVFTEEETKEIIKWLKDHPTVGNLGIVLVFQTGLREAELAALKYCDVDGNILNVRRQEVRYKDESGKMIYEIVPYTKTEAGERGVILTPKALETIKMIRRLNPFGEYMMQVGDKKIGKVSFNDYLYKACDALGIERRSMHKIRKTYGTMLIDSGADDSTVMEQMGHADITTTRKFYYFSNKSHQEKVEQVQRAINI